MSLLLLWDSKRRDKGTGRSQAGREKLDHHNRNVLVPESWYIKTVFNGESNIFEHEKLWHEVKFEIDVELENHKKTENSISVRARRIK